MYPSNSCTELHATPGGHCEVSTTYLGYQEVYILKESKKGMPKMPKNKSREIRTKGIFLVQKCFKIKTINNAAQIAKGIDAYAQNRCVKMLNGKCPPSNPTNVTKNQSA